MWYEVHPLWDRQKGPNYSQGWSGTVTKLEACFTPRECCLFSPESSPPWAFPALSQEPPCYPQRPKAFHPPGLPLLGTGPPPLSPSALSSSRTHSLCHFLLPWTLATQVPLTPSVDSIACTCSPHGEWSRPNTPPGTRCTLFLPINHCSHPRVTPSHGCSWGSLHSPSSTKL